MIEKDDRIIQMLLYNSYDSDMTYQRPDMTTYIHHIRKDKPDTFSIPETQLELFHTTPPNRDTIPYPDTLRLYYGENHKFTEAEGLEDHY